MVCEMLSQFLLQPSTELLDCYNERLGLRLANNTGLVIHQSVTFTAGVFEIKGELPLFGRKEGFQFL